MPVEKTRFSIPVILLMGGGTLILIGIIAAAIWLAVNTASLGADVMQARQTRTVASETLETLLNAETSQRGYLLTGDDRYLAPYRAALPVLGRNLASLGNAEEGNAPLQAQVKHLKDISGTKLAELAQTVGLAQAGHRDQAIALVKTNQGINEMDDARHTLGVIIADGEARVTRDIDNLNSNALILKWVTMVGGSIVVLFGIIAMGLVYRSMLVAARARSEVEELNVSLEDRVVRRTEALTRANDEIQRFAYIVSHDLRAPLVNIMGFTSELETGTKALNQYFESGAEADKPPAKDAAVNGLPEAVRFIRSSTGKMDRLINAILKLSREGRRELTPENVDLNAIFTAITGSLQHQIEETHTAIDIPARLPVVVSDRLAVEQVFSNLIDNALKYLAPGRPGRITVESHPTPAAIIVSVKDNGRGIAQNDLERVFELFRRAGRQDKPGEGIGLAHVRALVRRMGGDISVSSTLGEGSEFRVSLPRFLPSETGNNS